MATIAATGVLLATTAATATDATAATATDAVAAALPSQKPLLEDAAPSIDVLVQRFLDALEKKDWKALRRLRVTEYEYRYVIMPGTVPPGQPQREYPADVSKYFWGTLNTKSAYSEDNLLKVAGGHHFTVKDLHFAKGTRTYATYSGYGQVRLRVEDDEGKERELATGSIAEVDGQYKFISFIRD